MVQPASGMRSWLLRRRPFGSGSLALPPLYAMVTSLLGGGRRRAAIPSSFARRWLWSGIRLVRRSPPYPHGAQSVLGHPKPLTWAGSNFTCVKLTLWRFSHILLFASRLCTMLPLERDYLTTGGPFSLPSCSHPLAGSMSYYGSSQGGSLDSQQTVQEACQMTKVGLPIRIQPT